MTDQEIIDRYENNWRQISSHPYLTEEFIEKYKDKVDWFYISYFQNLSEKFIKKHIKRVLWLGISVSQKLSDDFIKKHMDKLGEFQLIKNEHIGLKMKLKLLKKKGMLEKDNSSHYIEYSKASNKDFDNFKNIIDNKKNI